MNAKPEQAWPQNKHKENVLSAAGEELAWEFFPKYGLFLTTCGEFMQGTYAIEITLGPSPECAPLRRIFLSILIQSYSPRRKDGRQSLEFA